MFRHAGRLYRQINRCYAHEYSKLMESGLYDSLVAVRLLIPHREAAVDIALTGEVFKVIEPLEVDFISYPWEWCFSQLKDAALATLEIQMIALEHGMVLKDASAFNIQFHRGVPVLIDTLSFETYREGEPWIAYRQFCQHFLAPLLLAAKRDYRLLKLTRSYIDGIPLDLASTLLPRSSWLKYSVLAHIHLHARAQSRYADSGKAAEKSNKVTVSPLGLRALIDSLRSCVNNLTWRSGSTEWGDYYGETNYLDSAMDDKARLVDACLESVPARGLLLDLGANTGKFSQLGLARGYKVIAMDTDELAIERCYLKLRSDGVKDMIPLVQDLSNPTPALGWAHSERMSLLERGPVKVVMALALIHHLAISNNVPLEQCAKFFASLGDYLIIEFVPKSDSQVKRLLHTREDLFPDYNLEGFEAAFFKYYVIERSEPIADSLRRLYLLSPLAANPED